MSVVPLFHGSPPAWLAPHLDNLAGFCSADRGRTAAVDALPVTVDDGQELIAELRADADVIALLVVTNDQPLLQDVVVAGFEPFSRVSSPDGDRFLFYARTKAVSYVWPALDDRVTEPVAA